LSTPDRAGINLPDINTPQGEKRARGGQTARGGCWRCKTQTGALAIINAAPRPSNNPLCCARGLMNLAKTLTYVHPLTASRNPFSRLALFPFLV